MLKRAAAIIVAFFTVVAAGMGLYVVNAGGPAMPSFDEVRASYRSSEARLLDRHGEVIHELRLDPEGRRVEWKPMGEVSPALVKAVLQSEDRRFYSHGGIDLLAASRASMRRLFSDGSSGASTITMQLASMVKKDLRPKGKRRDLKKKWMQALAALEVERNWSKEEILEAYLNLVTFRGELQGVSAASWGLFGKDPSGLDNRESLVLAALVRSPNARPDAASRRAMALAHAMGEPVAEGDIKALVTDCLTGPYRARKRPALAFNVASMLLKEADASVVSTLDATLQRFAMEALERHMGQLSGQNVTDGAVLVVHNKTGEVLAYVANRGKLSVSRYVDGVRAKRQAGSTLKPFLYALAFEKRILTPASILNDEPVDIQTGRGIYSPENYDNLYRGPVSARTALASSLNTPAVRVAEIVGGGPLVERLGRLGVEGLMEGDFYGPSIALGTPDVSLWELVNAYRALANGGVYSGATLTPVNSGVPGGRVFSKSAAFIVSDILSDRAARSATFGLENPLSTSFWSAAKTGTSKDMRDNWCVGYSRDYTVGVWVGNMDGSSMWDVSGVSGAAPIWLDVMNYLHRGKASRPPVPPDGVVQKEVSFGGTVRKEWFLTGTEPEGEIQLAMAEPMILYPPDGAILAIDPDMPVGNQRVLFEAEGSGSFVWALDGIAVGEGGGFLWAPIRGSHELALLDTDGRQIDKASFEVR